MENKCCRREDCCWMRNEDDLLKSVAEEIISCSDPNITKETLVLRCLKNLTEKCFNLPWVRVLETIRQGQCYLDEQSHQLLVNISAAVTASTLINQEVLDRIASKDYVKKSDLDRLALTLSSSTDASSSVDVCRFFAVDGFVGFGEDLRPYVSMHFSKCNEEYKILHVRAVRKLYEHCKDARQVHRVLQQIFSNNTDDETKAAVDAYLEVVGAERLNVIKTWKEKESPRENNAKKKQKAVPIAKDGGKKIASGEKNKTIVTKITTDDEDDSSSQKNLSVLSSASKKRKLVKMKTKPEKKIKKENFKQEKKMSQLSTTTTNIQDVESSQQQSQEESLAQEKSENDYESSDNETNAALKNLLEYKSENIDSDE